MRALITGITGQDGSFLAEFLLKMGYEVFGLVRRTSTPILANIAHIQHKITLVQGDMTDLSSLIKVLASVQPDEVYNLAAQSHVQVSFGQPVTTMQINACGTVNLIEALRILPKIPKLYHASTSEMYGNNGRDYNLLPDGPFSPRSPYGYSKVAAHHAVVNYRESCGAFACCGILFNHESPRRGESFVTRKITRSAAAIAERLNTKLELGNLDAKRDWGYAGDYVEAMWLMLQQDKPRDYIVGTGEAHSVREFVKEAFAYVGLFDPWQYVTSNPEYVRPTEIHCLVADNTIAIRELGWKPKVSFVDLVHMMVDSDRAMVRSYIQDKFKEHF